MGQVFGSISNTDNTAHVVEEVNSKRNPISYLLKTQTDPLIQKILLNVEKSNSLNLSNCLLDSKKFSQWEPIFDTLLRYCGSKLVEINLFNNQLAQVPLVLLDHMIDFTNVTSIDLSHNAMLDDLDPSIASCVNLKQFVCNGTRIKSIPQEFGKLKYLQKLECNYNIHLQSFPTCIFSLPSLVTFNMKCCHFASAIPHSQQQSTEEPFSLQVLHLYNNCLEEFPNSFFEKFFCIKELNLSKNNLKTFPLAVTTLAMCKKLDISRNGIKEIPSQINQMKQLVELHAMCNEISILPQDIRLPLLKLVNFCNNSISSLSNAFSPCVALEALNISCNQVTQVSNEALQQMTELQELCLSGNMIEEFPIAVVQCKKMARLRLGYNRIKEIPTGIIKELPLLTELFLNGNQLLAFPFAELQFCNRLSRLYLGDNALEYIPVSILPLIKSNISHLSLWGNGLSDSTFPIQSVMVQPNFHSEEDFLKTLKSLDLAYNQFNCPSLTTPLLKQIEKYYPKLDFYIHGNNNEEWNQFRTEKFSIKTSPFIQFGFSEACGPFRNTMEDSIVLQSDLLEDGKYHLFAVFDGHGGIKTALLAAQNLPKLFIPKLQQLEKQQTGSDGDVTFWKPALQTCTRNAILELNAELKEIQEHVTDGATVLICLIRKTKTSTLVCVANAGDARAVLGKYVPSTQTITTQRVSRDHKPDELEEIQRIHDLGGVIIEGRVKGSLAISRSIGDFIYAPLVTCEPYLQTLEIVPNNQEEEHVFLILACDGLYDVILDHQAVETVVDTLFQMDVEIDNNALDFVSARLRDLALAVGSTDNCTVATIML